MRWREGGQELAFGPMLDLSVARGLGPNGPFARVGFWLEADLRHDDDDQFWDRPDMASYGR